MKKRTYLFCLCATIFLFVKTNAQHLSLEKDVVAPGKTIIVHCSGFENYPGAWVCIAKKSSLVTSNGIDWKDPKKETLEFSVSEYGDYEIRGYLTREHVISIRVPLRVGNSDINTRASTQKLIALGQPIEVKFSGFPGNHSDWICIVHANSGVTGLLGNKELKGLQEGKITFDPIPEGDYDILGFFNNEEIIRTRFRFKVGQDNTPKKQDYTIGDIQIEDPEKSNETFPIRKNVQRLTEELKNAVKQRDAILAKIAPQQTELNKLSALKVKKENKIQKVAKQIQEAEIRDSRIEEIRKMFKENSYPASKEKELRNELFELEQKQWNNGNGSNDDKDRKELLKRYTEEYEILKFKEDSIQKSQLSPLKNEFDARQNIVRDFEGQLSSIVFDLHKAKATPSIEEITVSSNGSTVYKAVWNITPEAIQLKDLIEKAKNTRDKTEKLKKAAFDTYKQASDKAVDAGRKLEGWSGTIMTTAYLNALVDGLFFIGDVGKAWGKAGPIGALAEAAKKLGEKYLFDDGNFTGEVDENSIAAEINKEYDAQIKDPESSSYQLNTIVKTGIERTVKEVGTKPIKEYAQKNVLSYVQLMATVELDLRKKADDIDKYLKRFQSFAADHSADKKWVDKYQDLRESLIKDLLKATAKSVIAEREKLAWEDYFWKDISARALFPVVQSTTTNFFKADSIYEDLIGRQQQLINEKQIDPKQNFKVIVNQPFYPDDKLEINLKMRTEYTVYKERVKLGFNWTSFQRLHNYSIEVPEKLYSNTKVPLVIQRFEKPRLGWEPSSYEK